MGTLLLDLLTPEEERIDAFTRQLQVDIELLTERTTGVLRWLATIDAIADLPAGLFGSNAGAAAALRAAAILPDRIAAIVSRGGRTDLADPVLDQIRAPTLLVVGAHDYPVLQINRDTLRRLASARARTLKVVPGAGHLFEEPGALEQVAALARDWFRHHLTATDEPSLRAGRPRPRSDRSIWNLRRPP